MYEDEDEDVMYYYLNTRHVLLQNAARTRVPSRILRYAFCQKIQPNVEQQELYLYPVLTFGGSLRLERSCTHMTVFT